MDLHSTKSSGKTLPLKSKTNLKLLEARKAEPKGPLISSQKRVFGISRSANVTAKPAIEKPTLKQLSAVFSKQQKSSQLPPSATDVDVILKNEAPKEKSPSKTSAGILTTEIHGETMPNSKDYETKSPEKTHGETPMPEAAEKKFLPEIGVLNSSFNAVSNLANRSSEKARGNGSVRNVVGNKSLDKARGTIPPIKTAENKAPNKAKGFASVSNVAEKKSVDETSNTAPMTLTANSKSPDKARGKAPVTEATEKKSPDIVRGRASMISVAKKKPLDKIRSAAPITLAAQKKFLDETCNVAPMDNVTEEESPDETRGMSPKNEDTGKRSPDRAEATMPKSEAAGKKSFDSPRGVTTASEAAELSASDKTICVTPLTKAAGKKSPNNTKNRTMINDASKQESPDKIRCVSEKKIPDKSRARLQKGSVSFPKNPVQKPIKHLQAEATIGPQTPLQSPSTRKPKIEGTPYHSAEKCSKCRSDRLETSSYWLGQIKLAETEGKHFVSAAFFQLAIESKAQPIGNLRVELKRYLARHQHLSAENEWRAVFFTYGLPKDKSSTGGVYSYPQKAASTKAMCDDPDQEHNESTEIQ